MNKYIKSLALLAMIPFFAGCVLLSNPVPTNTMIVKVPVMDSHGNVITTATFKGVFHKDVNLQGATFGFSISNGFWFSLTNLASSNNVAVVNASYVGQNTEQSTLLTGAGNLMNGAANLMKGAATTYVTGGASALVPSSPVVLTNK